MSELVHLKGNTYLIKGLVNCGLVVNGQKECILIDSGLDEGYGRRILKTLLDNEWHLSAVINTHSHADHCGGNGLLQKRTQAEFYASSFEAAIIQNPIMEPYYLFGAAPPPQLRGKLLMAQPTRNVHLLKEGMSEIGGSILRIIPLPGHSAEQMGVLTTDGIMFVGDALFPAAVWDKYKVPYFENVENALSTLEKLEKMTCEGFVIAHHGFVEDIGKLAAYNIQGLKGLLTAVREMMGVPLSREDLMSRLIRQYDVPVNLVQYFMLNSCIAGFLTYMIDQGWIEPVLTDGQLLWQQTGQEDIEA